MKVDGHLERVDIGPGAWVLVAADGQRYALQARPRVAAGFIPGAAVSVEGELEDALGVDMLGEPVLAVKRVSR